MWLACDTPAQGIYLSALPTCPNLAAQAAAPDWGLCSKMPIFS